MSADILPLPVFDDPRRVSLDLRDHVRRLIIDELLPAGTILKQAELARAFGVSRTPMREAFRMLLEEGLIDAETNQRARVRELDPGELDQLYGVRIALESLGARITAGRVTAREADEAREMLAAMKSAFAQGDKPAWVDAHRRFHRLCVARADEPLARVIRSYSERTERYVRLHQVLHPNSYAGAQADHEGILDALLAGDRDLAGMRMAHHLATTSLTVLRDVSPDASGVTIAEALQMAARSARS
ncbi:GntR family transcriptional regulator [Microbacterium sp. ARD31]|uniref:GntR family transcriptional regulator n=1 Tax=Microbacterium sp. ARD31 TaxID=2962576 RepID=UPI002880DF6F|nr:GntR family transcriptional regulator [Microbacterium sp. ARD31]MDT0183952.1 GntR family transcriptional regulator [Microbacterium sp. ARD31]